MISVVPSRRQIAHQRREFYGFVHFTVNTFTGKEWGDGTEDEAIFNPVKMDSLAILRQPVMMPFSKAGFVFRALLNR